MSRVSTYSLSRVTVPWLGRPFAWPPFACFSPARGPFVLSEIPHTDSDRQLRTSDFPFASELVISLPLSTLLYYAKFCHISRVSTTISPAVNMTTTWPRGWDSSRNSTNSLNMPNTTVYYTSEYHQHHTSPVYQRGPNVIHKDGNKRDVTSTSYKIPNMQAILCLTVKPTGGRRPLVCRPRRISRYAQHWLPSPRSVTWRVQCPVTTGATAH